MIYCRQCGKKIAEGVRCCPYCGAENRTGIADPGSFSDSSAGGSSRTAAGRSGSSHTAAGKYGNSRTAAGKSGSGHSSSGNHLRERTGPAGHRNKSSGMGLPGLFILIGLLLLVSAGAGAWLLRDGKQQRVSSGGEPLQAAAGEMTDRARKKSVFVQAVRDAEEAVREKAGEGIITGEQTAAGLNKESDSGKTEPEKTGTSEPEKTGTSEPEKTEPAEPEKNEEKETGSGKQETGEQKTEKPAAVTTADDPGKAAAAAESQGDPENTVGIPEGQSDEDRQSVILAVSRSSASSVRAFDVQDYDAFYVLDNDGTTAWSEGVDGYGLGEYIEFEIPEGTVVTGGEIQPGFYKSEDLFYRNGAPTVLTLSSGGSSCQADISAYASGWKGRDSVCRFTLADSFVSDGTVRVAIGGFRTGTQYDDTMISELRLTGYAPEGMQAEAMAGIGNPEAASDSTMTAAAESGSQQAAASAGEPAGNAVTVKTDVRANAMMAYGALRAKYGRAAQMVHGMHWCMDVPGLPYEIEFMAGGFSEDGAVSVLDTDAVWHVAGNLQSLLDGTQGSYSPEAFADVLRINCSEVTCTMENGAGTGYYLSDRYAAFTFLDERGQYWSLEIDQSGQNTVTGDSYAWLGILP